MISPGLVIASMKYKQYHFYRAEKSRKAQHGWLEIFVLPSAVEESSSSPFSMSGGIGIPRLTGMLGGFRAAEPPGTSRQAAGIPLLRPC